MPYRGGSSRFWHLNAMTQMQLQLPDLVLKQDLYPGSSYQDGEMYHQDHMHKGILRTVFPTLTAWLASNLACIWSDFEARMFPIPRGFTQSVMPTQAMVRYHCRRSAFSWKDTFSPPGPIPNKALVEENWRCEETEVLRIKY